MIAGDVVQEKAEKTKIHWFEFLSENIVMFIFTLVSKFTYKGMPNDDLFLFLKKWIMFGKFIGCKRSTGNLDLYFMGLATANGPSNCR